MGSRQRGRRSVRALGAAGELLAPQRFWIAWQARRFVAWLELVWHRPRFLAYGLSLMTRAGASNPGLALAVLSVALTLALAPFAALVDSFPTSALLLFLLCTLGAIVASLLSTGLIAIASLSPEALAEHSIGGRSARAILEILAARSYLLIRLSNRRLAPLDPLIADLNEGLSHRQEHADLQWYYLREFWRRRRRVFARLERGLELLQRRQDLEASRIHALVQRASASLDLRPERLTGAVLHFSPTLFREKFQDLLARCQEVESMVESVVQGAWHGAEQKLDRVVDLSAQLGDLLKQGRGREELQLEILDQRRVNDHLLDVVRARSASSAMLRYAEALARVSSVGATSTIRYIYRFQRAVPGITPSLLLLRLLIETRRSDRRRSYWSQSGVLRRLIRGLLALEMDYRGFEVSALDEPEAFLRYLRELPRYVQLYMQAARTALATHLARCFETWRETTEARILLLTHGNSSTVRDALHQALSQDELSWTRDKLLIVCFPSDDDPMMLEPRRLIQSLRDGVPRELRDRSAILRPETFIRLPEPGDSVLLIVGTEAIDRSGRFVHPVGLRELQATLRSQMAERGIRFETAVLAESYKKQSIDFTELRASGDHIDKGLEIFERCEHHAEVLITEQGVESLVEPAVDQPIPNDGQRLVEGWTVQRGSWRWLAARLLLGEADAANGGAGSRPERPPRRADRTTGRSPKSPLS